MVTFKNAVTPYVDLSNRLIGEILSDHDDPAVIRTLALKVLEKHGNISSATRIARDLRTAIQSEYAMQDADMVHVVGVQGALLHAIEEWLSSRRQGCAA